MKPEYAIAMLELVCKDVIDSHLFATRLDEDIFCGKIAAAAKQIRGAALKRSKKFKQVAILGDDGTMSLR